MNAHNRLCVLVLAAAVMVTAPLAAATNTAAKQSYNVAWFTTKSDRFLAAEFDAGLKEAKKLNINITLFDSGYDVNKEYSQIQDAITLAKFQGFIIFPVDGPPLVPVVEQALRKGIKVVGAGQPLGPNPYSGSVQIKGVSAEVTTSPVAIGKRMALQIIQACRGIDPCNFAYLAGVAALPVEGAVKAAITPAIKPYPNIHEIAYLDGTNFTVAGGEKVAADLLASHPDVNVIASLGDAPSGVILALRAARRSFGTGKDQIRVLAGGAPCATIALLKAGEIYNTQPSTPATEGTIDVKVMAAALRGSTRVQAIDPVISAKIAPVITKANVTSFHCEY